jgi:hypothetical protein
MRSTPVSTTSILLRIPNLRCFLGFLQRTRLESVAGLTSNLDIITNRICDQLTNVCGANQAAKDACTSAKATVQALGTKDASTATAFNQALGF